jgi:hypothetical protein
LVPWLREQVADLRKVALTALRGYPFPVSEPDESDTDHWHSHWDDLFQAPGRDNYVGGREIARFPQAPHAAAFVARFDPAAALAQCEAHEALLDAYENAEARRVRLTEAFTRNLRKIAELDPAEERRRYSEVSTANGVATGYGMSVLLAASAYRHRPGYREEWRPT